MPSHFCRAFGPLSTGRFEAVAIWGVWASLQVACTPVVPSLPNADGGKPGALDGGDPGLDFQAEIAPIPEGRVDQTFTLDGSRSQNPLGRALAWGWQVRLPEGEGCQGQLSSANDAIATFQPSCNGTHVAVLTLQSVEGDVSLAEREFWVRNHAPVLANLQLESAFDVGEVAVVTADVTDLDNDPTRCRIALSPTNVGDPEGLLLPTMPADDCRFSIATPARMERWTLSVIADDGLDDSAPATLDIVPRNNPPVLEQMTLSEPLAAYVCEQDACRSLPIEVALLASDDVDAAEAMEYLIEDATLDAPDGTYLVVEPIPDAPARFEVSIGRDGLGPMAGSFAIRGQVTELTATMPASATLERAFTVENASPLLTDVTLLDTDHEFEGSQNRYRAQFVLDFLASDPEHNELNAAVDVVDCPSDEADAGSCESGLVVQSQATDTGLRLDLEAETVSRLVGPFSFRLSVTDADGAVTSTTASASVSNHPPTLHPALATQRAQRYVSGAHQGTFDFVVDDDNDPLTYEMEVTCPGGDRVALGAMCAAGQVITLSEAGQLLIRGPAHPDFLGDYRFVGHVTDGFDTLAVDQVFTVTNTAPVMMVGSATPQICDHRTELAADRVRNEDGCSFVLQATATDDDGDPLVLIGDDSASPFGVLFANTERTGDTFSRRFDVETSVDTFLNTFDAMLGFARGTVWFRIADPFDASPASAAVQYRLLNRAPEGYSESTPIFSAHHKTTGTTVTNEGTVRFFYMATATDPDGDALELFRTSPTSGFSVIHEEQIIGSNRYIVGFDLQMTLADFVNQFDANTGAASTTMFFGVADSLGGVTAGLDVDIHLTNRAPTATVTSSATQGCDHQTQSGSVVTSQSGCAYTFAATVHDPDGDPLTLAGDDPAGADGFTPIFEAATVTSSSASQAFVLTTNYNNFKSKFAGNAAATTARFTLRDVVQTGPAPFTMTAQLYNRAPTLSSVAFRNAAGTGSPAPLPVNELQVDTGEQIWTARRAGAVDCSALGRSLFCIYPDPYHFSVVVNGADPDGDPMEVSLDVTCDGENSIEAVDGLPLGTPRAYGAGGHIGLSLPGTTGHCGVGNPPYRQWMLTGSRSCSQFGCIYTSHAVRCTVNASTLTDALSSVALATPVTIPLSHTPGASSSSYSCGL